MKPKIPDIPHSLAVFGFVLYHEKHRIHPTAERKKLKIAHLY
jgi:hypothetical protein